MKTQKTRFLLPAALSLLVVPSLALAADPVQQLPTVRVTDTRGVESDDEPLAAVTVINRDEIESSQARSVQDLLAGLAGLSISNNGGAGKLSSIFVRGTESDHILVLVDGIPLSSATSGTAAFQDLPIEQIDRIEIVRGPRSALYGSQAIGGVIQIFTRDGGGAPTQSFSIGGGSHESWNTSAAMSGSSGRAIYSAGISKERTQGINACRGSLSAGCFTVEPDKDGYENVGVSLHGGYRFAGGGEADLRWLRSDAESEYDGSEFGGNQSQSTTESLSLHLATPKIGPWRARLDGGRSRDLSDAFYNGAFNNRYDTQKNSAALLNDFSLAASQTLTLGLDYLDERVDSSTLYEATSRDNTGVFVQYLASLAGIDLQGALRSDDNQQYGRHTTGNIAFGGVVTGPLRWLASYGTGFKAPTFNELYFPDFGNPDLNPEKSRSYEIGLNARYGWGRWTLNAFQNEIDELIGLDADFNPVNIDKARIRGVEATLAGEVLGLTYRTAATYLDPQNRSAGANRGNDLPRRATRSFRIDLDRPIGAFSIGTTVRGEGRRYDNTANTREMGGYATVDLRAEVAFAKSWRLQLRGQNLLDKQYETAKFYNQDGAAGWVTLRYNLSQ